MKMHSEKNSFITFCNTEDFKRVQELAYHIWPKAYAEILSKDQLDYMLDKMYSVEALDFQYKNQQIFIKYIHNNEMIGFASFEHKYAGTNKTKIHKLYLLHEFQGKGFGKEMVNFIQHQAIEKKDLKLILNVNRYNKAFYFYQKLGFSVSETVDIPIGNGYLMEDYVMEKSLV